MDELKISTRFTRMLVSKLIEKALTKKFGCQVGIQLNGINVAIVDGKARIHLDIDGEMSSDDLSQIVKNIG